jgi:GT2 family glycosyltransferase
VQEERDSPAGSPLDVIVVAYHSGSVLRGALAALRAFAPDSRLIVVDNSPEDPSAADAARGLPKAELLSESSNVGFAAAVNHGLAVCTADVVLLANPDILSLDGSLGEVRQSFETRPTVGAVTVRLLDASGRLQHCRRSFGRYDLFAPAVGVGWLPRRWTLSRGNSMLEWDHAEERIVEQATGALLFLRRAAVLDVGPFDERFFMYWEETDWLERARAKGWQLLYTPAVSGVHAVRSSTNRAGTNHSALLLESTHKYTRKHFGRATSLALRAVWIVADAARLVASARAPMAYRREVLERLSLNLGFRPPGRPGA